VRQVGLFAEEPIAFDDLWRRAAVMDVGSTKVRVASIADLIRLRRFAGRAVDRSDIAELEKLRGEDEGGDG